MHIRKGDTVEIICGADRGHRGRVLQVDHEAGKAVVEGVARVFKHVRRSQKHPQGGRLSKEMPLELSNVQLVCDSCKKTTRTGAKQMADGSKQRCCKKCGAAIGMIAPARASRAKVASKK